MGEDLGLVPLPVWWFTTISNSSPIILAIRCRGRGITKSSRTLLGYIVRPFQKTEEGKGGIEEDKRKEKGMRRGRGEGGDEGRAQMTNAEITAVW